MTIIILWALGVVFLLGAFAILVLQERRIKKGIVVFDENFVGPEKVSETLHTMIRIFLKRSIYIRKFCMQYVLHVMVRGMYYFDIFTRRMYEVSRNWFVKNAVKNKGTVPHFWEHLKVYKQEIDKERNDEDLFK
ncbi:MAG: hypothetical protein RI935_325 [Candidatus Parcubacteria bacterium]|jgi:hypothetical protein